MCVKDEMFIYVLVNDNIYWESLANYLLQFSSKFKKKYLKSWSSCFLAVSVSEAFDRITLRYKQTSGKEANESVVKKKLIIEVPVRHFSLRKWLQSMSIVLCKSCTCIITTFRFLTQKTNTEFPQHSLFILSMFSWNCHFLPLFKLYRFQFR